MDIQTISSRAFSVYISEGELKSRHLDPEHISRDEVYGMICSELSERNLGSVSIELFPGHGDLLVFVKRSAGAPCFFTFEDLEDLISAAASCREAEPSALYFYDDVYFLSVHSWNKSGPPDTLFEFGELFLAPPEFEAFLKEHGKVLIPFGAIHKLKSSFSDKNNQS